MIFGDKPHSQPGMVYEREVVTDDINQFNNIGL